ncbi:helix-turn-helix transcriptional regulator [Caulobacter sp. 17J65-9]|nr:helix-turn-helix transcriptional regulator [Caulobacter sp. 17J65-9]
MLRVEGEPAFHLTARELEIVKLLASGLSVRAASIQLGLSTRTVESYVKQSRLKLGARNQAHMIAQAMNSGLIG